MPRRDGTGPDGKGPGTGRGMGHCNENGSKDTGTFGSGKRGGRRRCGRNCRWDESDNSGITKN